MYPALLPLVELRLETVNTEHGEWTPENFLPRSLAVSWAPATMLVFDLEA